MAQTLCKRSWSAISIECIFSPLQRKAQSLCREGLKRKQAQQLERRMLQMAGSWQTSSIPAIWCTVEVPLGISGNSPPLPSGFPEFGRRQRQRRTMPTQEPGTLVISAVRDGPEEQVTLASACCWWSLKRGGATRGHFLKALIKSLKKNL